MRTLLKIVEDGAAAVMILLLCMSMLPLIMELFGIHIYCVQSGSMEPVLKTGSIIFLGKSDTIVPGDIVTFQKWDTAVTHRVIREENGNYITKGDANIREDNGTVSKSQMKGKVIKLPGGRYCIPYIGYLQAAVAEWKWVMLGLLLIHRIIKRKKEVKVYVQ